MPNSLCLVDLSTAFYLEGTSLCNSPQLFSLETESLLSLSLMQEARFCPGVAFLSPHLYVFAGATDACERLSLITRQWSAIAAFPYAVTGMSTCTRLDNIYLAANYRYSLQVFYTLENRFETLKMSQPFTGRLLWAGQKELVIIGSEKVCKAQIKGQHVLIVQKSSKMFSLFVSWTHSSLPPGKVRSLGPTECNEKAYLLLQEKHSALTMLVTFDKDQTAISCKPILR